MTWKRAIRSIATTARRIERDQERHARSAAKHFKQLQKQQDIEDAAQAVQTYNEYIQIIQSMHHDCSEHLDWEDMLQENAPPYPSISVDHERAAKQALETYQPTFFDRLLKRGPAKLQRLEEAIEIARRRDEQVTKDWQADYERQLAEWQDRQDLAQNVLAKNCDVYAQVLELFAPFEGINDLGSRMEFTFTADHIEVDLDVNSTEVIPDFAVSQLASGKISRKQLSASKFNELYQDYVCSCMLRVAREVQAHLPISQVVIHAFAEQFNTATGQREKQLIISAAMSRETMSQLNYSSLDPSDSMRNFNHTMKFTKIGGFQPVDRVGLAAPLLKKRP